MEYTEVAPEFASRPKWDSWAKWVFFLLLGYSITGRSFAYLGVPPAKLFIGDLTLAAFIFLRPRKLFDPWINALVKSGPLTMFAWVLLASISYGIFEVIRGLLSGFSPLTALQNLVFNVYPIFLFLGLWVGSRYKNLLFKYIQVFCICFCIYAPLYFLFLDKLKVTMPGSDGVTVFGQPGGGGFIIVALLCLAPKPSRYWVPMIVGGALLLAGQVRAEWLGLGIALMIWGVLKRKMTRVVGIAVGIVVILGIGFVLDVNIPSPGERGGAIASSEIVARGLSAVSPDFARDVTGSSMTGFYAGTITWREKWWHAIWANSQDNYTNLLIGPGYGFELHGLVGYLRNMADLRTPHNIFYYALGYSGWIGVILFFSLQTICGMMLWRSYRIDGQPFGLTVWASSVITSFFGNSMETPMGAIPYYLTLGLIIGPNLSVLRSRAHEKLLRTAPSAYSPQGAYAPEGAYTSEAI